MFTLHVGNTHTTLAGWRAGKTVRRLAWKTGTGPSRSVARMLQAAVARGAPVVLAGVVPEQKRRLAAFLRKRGGEVLVFRKDLKPRIAIVPRAPECVGDDRIAGALGALALDSTCPWVVVDAGTAVTINAVTPGRAGRPPRFEGGLILPGGAACLRALSHLTAQLPLLEPRPAVARRSGTFIGRSTQEAMLLGVRLSQLAAVTALALGQRDELGPRTRVVLTGGGAGQLGLRLGSAYETFRRGTCVNADLVHLGLYSTWKARMRK